MKNLKNSYNKLNEKEKIDIINLYYIKKEKSFDEISEMYNTYPNRLRRDAKKFNIPIRSRSQAQKNALKKGRTTHPTKGMSRSIETKQKIGMAVLQNWQNMDEKKLKQIKQKQKEIWNSKSEEEKANLQQAANNAIRLSSKVGSKLEKFLLSGLIENNIDTKFHYEQTLVNTRLQIDLYIPSINLAIEVDGPSHFDPVWGQETLQKTKTYDDKKQGLIIGKGMKLVRIKQKMDFSMSRSRLILDKLLFLVDQISNNLTNEEFYEIKDI
jgi:very-short-patch-repair endonuclease|tara:strand:- start:35037 stop:35840 length:804 start_codon:yes stop_codon:yes gene_type:complete